MTTGTIILLFLICFLINGYFMWRGYKNRQK